MTCEFLMKNYFFLLTRKQKWHTHIVYKETIWREVMEHDLNTILSTLINTFELINNALKKNADPVLIDYSITEMHCIECIGKIENPNVTKISKMLNITRGGISKLIKKLIQKGSVEEYFCKENKKEIYYRLTKIGLEVFEAHEKIHQEWNDKDIKFFSQYDNAEIKFVLQFINDYTEHLKKNINKI